MSDSIPPLSPDILGVGTKVRYSQPDPDLGVREGTGKVTQEYWVDGEPGRHGVRIATDYGFTYHVDESIDGAYVEPIPGADG